MTNPKGMPKNAPDELLAERLELRLTTVERQEYERAAEKSHLSLSAWIRDRLGKLAKRESAKK